ncbi:uncharacterized protein [Haliotis asinina]|uniref:uncharacterized protein n=1 Tax=Haliotis asinina TaxID=109174 RepID=UPI003531D287
MRNKKRVVMALGICMISVAIILYAYLSRRNVVVHTSSRPDIAVQNVDGAYSKLLELYQKKLQDLQKSNLWSTIPDTPTCTKEMHPSKLCTDPDCHQDIPDQPAVRLENLLNSMHSDDLEKVKRISQLKELQVQPTGKQILFLTGSSSNHFMESQAMLKNFHETIPAVFSNYSLRYFDLGLRQAERAQVSQLEHYKDR